jgi:hypothetical protein
MSITVSMTLILQDHGHWAAPGFLRCFGSGDKSGQECAVAFVAIAPAGNNDPFLLGEG